MYRHTTFVLALVLASTLLLPIAAAASDGGSGKDRQTSAENATVAELEDELVRIVNAERRSRGLPALRVTLQQQRKAREHSAVMADTRDLHHAPNLGSEVFPSDAWAGMAENIVQRRTVESAHRAFMDSPAHRDNVLDDRWTHLGVGISVDGSDLWITQRFVAVRDGHTLPMFVDMPTAAWKRETVREAWREGLLAGCGADRVCADDPVSRAQTATLLARVLDRDPDVAGSSRFADVPREYVHAGAIGALAADGITLGCASDRFCPHEPVSRAATASLISRASGWSELVQDRFEDVVREHTHAGTINRLAERRVTDGCSSDRYCPSRPVTRVETARMLSRAF
jgi:uncharacterized protein YkwD